MQIVPVSPPDYRLRAGFTIVEVLVSLMLVAVGLLAIAGSTALTLRTTIDSTRRHGAAQQAASRLALLTAAGCAGATGGSAVSADRLLTERWMVGARINGFKTVADTVHWTGVRGMRSFTLASAIAC